MVKTYKVYPRTGHEGQNGIEVIYSFFDLGARWRLVFNATPRPLYPRERPGTHCIGGCVCPPEPVWTGAENLAPPQSGLDPRTDHPRSESLSQLIEFKNERSYTRTPPIRLNGVYGYGYHLPYTLALPAENEHVHTCVKFSGRELKATTVIPRLTSDPANEFFG